MKLFAQKKNEYFDQISKKGSKTQNVGKLSAGKIAYILVIKLQVVNSL